MDATETSYGLRDTRTKRLMRLEIESNHDRDFCGEERVKLSLDPDYPRFEVESLLGVIRVLGSDEDWFNTSRDRPGWGKFKPENLEIVRFERTMTYDGPDGSDPVAVSSSVTEIPFPGFVSARRFAGHRRNLPPLLLKRYFDVDLTDEQRDYSEVSVFRLEEGQLQEEVIGLFTRSHGIGNTGRIVAMTELPEDYPLDDLEARKLDRAGVPLVIALVTSSPDLLIEAVGAEGPSLGL